jgi:heme exporter protein D
MTEFLAMGGYARFVWPAYGTALVLLVGLLLLSLRHYRERQRQLDRLQRKR